MQTNTMQQKDIEFFKNILNAIEKIENFIEPVKDYHQLSKEEMISDAIILNLIVIVDMVNKISADTKKQHSDVTWSQVKKVEYNVTNNYIGINIEYVWKIVTEYIPFFKQQLQTI